MPAVQLKRDNSNTLTTFLSCSRCCNEFLACGSKSIQAVNVSGTGKTGLFCHVKLQMHFARHICSVNIIFKTIT
jgi:hypothetical protein